jgi:hypothetical protein
MMAYTTEQYEALKAAIAGGERTVRYADRSVEYRSIEEMMQILRLMESDLGINQDVTGRTLTSFSKGY